MFATGQQKKQEAARSSIDNTHTDISQFGIIIYYQLY